ncbi:MAG TPA: hypothetical protein VJN21_09125 [Candidatus Acidoferrales bacterium]|nr:hypothetical protein [Candidatus Acidoferrales bacterium]
MFLALLLVTLIASVAASAVVVWIFAKPIDRILARIVADELSQAWTKYITFAEYVVGISSGVNINLLEQYITPQEHGSSYSLTANRWILEVYRAIIGALDGLAWMLLLFFMFALVAYVIVRAFELRKERSPAANE